MTRIIQMEAITIRHLWKVHGITYHPIIQIVCEMALDRSLGYDEALEEWAATELDGANFGCWPASRWHSEICYRLLKTGREITGSVADWMEERAKEVRAIADGVSP